MKIKNWLDVKGGDKLKIKAEKVDVVNATIITESKNLCKFVLLNCTDSSGPFYLFAKIVDQEIDVRIYNEIGWIGVGDRARLMDTGNQRLFQQPTNPDDFQLCDLQWAESIEFIVNDNPVALNKKSNVYGEAIDRPKKTGIDKLFANVIEYAAVEKIDNPEVLILELGGIDENGDSVGTGGLVIPFEGFCINNDDVTTVGWFF